MTAAARRTVMTNERQDEGGGRVNTLIGPFPAEVNERHNAWVATSAGAMWQRDDVSQQLRSAVTLGVLTALGAERELSVHIRRAVKQGGLSRAEVAELLRHCSVYAGVPRANLALRLAKDVFDALDAEPAS
jgi:alkylhydroperoxidase/carboxymuconolactone decarboxylase family protein YurZ